MLDAGGLSLLFVVDVVNIVCAVLEVVAYEVDQTYHHSLCLCLAIVVEEAVGILVCLYECIDACPCGKSLCYSGLYGCVRGNIDGVSVVVEEAYEILTAGRIVWCKVSKDAVLVLFCVPERRFLALPLDAVLESDGYEEVFGEVVRIAEAEEFGEVFVAADDAVNGLHRRLHGTVDEVCHTVTVAVQFLGHVVAFND